MSSHERDKIYPALIKAQAEVKNVEFNATNPFFKSKYADLGSHIETIKPAFEKFGLGIVQQVISHSLLNNEMQLGVRTTVVHESGQYIESEVCLPIKGGPKAAQEAGAIITYLRRYSLGAIANVYSGGDVDGNPTPDDKVIPGAKATVAHSREDAENEVTKMKSNSAKTPPQPPSAPAKKSGFSRIDAITLLMDIDKSVKNSFQATAILTELKPKSADQLRVLAPIYREARDGGLEVEHAAKIANEKFAKQ